MIRTSILVSLALGLFTLAGCSAAPEDAQSEGESSALSSGSCKTNADCGGLQYCAKAEGRCGGKGKCKARGIGNMCVATVSPVCGCDGLTYKNGCEAQKRGVSLVASDACITQPMPYLLQYADTYDVAAPQATGLANVTLFTDGTYEATLASGDLEDGSYTTYDVPGLPLNVALTNGSNWWTAQITTYAGAMTITRDGATDTATPEHTVGPNESLCDDSGGAWGDDEADPKTGLFCTCPNGQSYVPAQGGCTRL